MIIDSAMFVRGECLMFLSCFVWWGREHRLKMVDTDREDWLDGGMGVSG